MTPTETLPATSGGTAPAPETPQEIASRWLASLDFDSQSIKEWEKRGETITKRYRQQKENSSGGQRFNLFWANVDTLMPATYSRRPKVEVFRRFNDPDPVGRLAATILQRAIQYEIDCGLELHQTMKSVVLDRLLPGRGVAWVRYEAAFEKAPTEVPAEGGLEVTTVEEEKVSDERTRVDYVYWKDFKHAPGRVWADVPWVARRVLLAKDAARLRFGPTIAKLGGNFDQISFSYDPTQPTSEGEKPAGKDQAPSELFRAAIWEICDKSTRQTIWVSKGVDTPLDIVDDQAELEGYFPCPLPLFATMTNDEVVPVPDYIIYEDQLKELDTVTQRINMLVKSLKVVGVYDASQTALADLLRPGTENKMVAVNAWAAFAEKGGLKGVMDFLPIEQVAKVLEGLYTSREQIKQTIYELTGMADIIRGASKASETLGAQQIKSKFANLRLSSRQNQVAEFVTSILRIKAEMMCNLYSPETLVRISSADQIKEAVEHPERVQQALQLLKSDKLRHYRIEVASDSMLEPDEAQERERRNDFMSTVANFMNAVKNIAGIAPEMMPVALEMLKFTVRGFSVGRSLESEIDDASDKIKERLANPPPQEPSDAQVKLQLEQFKQTQETLRVRMKEEAAEDRENLKAMLALTLQNMEQKMMDVFAGAAQGGKVENAIEGPGPGAAPPQQPPQGLPPGV
jgi:hypothetical protein